MPLNPEEIKILDGIADVLYEGPEKDCPANETPSLWCDRSHREWAVRNGPGISVILMTRFCDEKGLDSSGRVSLWTDIATIHSYNDTPTIFEALNEYATR